MIFTHSKFVVISTNIHYMMLRAAKDLIRIIKDLRD